MISLTRLFLALMDPTRRALFERVARGPACVSTLAGDFPVSRPAISHHLKVLSEAGLVRHRVDGRRHIYTVNKDGIAPLRTWLTSISHGEETTDAKSPRR